MVMRVQLQDQLLWDVIELGVEEEHTMIERCWRPQGRTQVELSEGLGPHLKFRIYIVFIHI
jgi:hypothetical protein